MTHPGPLSILNRMVHPEAPPEAATLNAVFAALSDATRRTVLETLGERSLSITELAEPHRMSLTGFMKHLRVLENAGLISRTKEGRIVRCELSPRPMQGAIAWLSRCMRRAP